MLKLMTMAVIILAVCSAGAFATRAVGQYFDNKYQENKIESFDDCVLSGEGAIIDNPMRCVDSSGNLFLK